MKCAIYTRVSTDEQGTSIINQQEYFKDYIERNKYEIFDIYSDEAFTGTESSKRLSFQRLLQDGKNKKYDVLLAKSYSRFGRNQRETLTALAQLFEAGIRIIFVEDGLDSQRDKGQFGLFAWLAEQESRKISERIKLTWQYYNKEGKIHTPQAPFGYDYNKDIKNFVINTKEAEIVKLIFELYLKGYGINKLTQYLNANNYPTKHNKEWYASTIQYILKNEFYIGNLVQGRECTIDVTLKKREKISSKNWYIHKNNHESIINLETFSKVQTEIKRRSDLDKQICKSKHSNEHLFSNLIRCKICGSSCTTKRKRSKGFAYFYSCLSYEAKGVKGSGHKRNAIREVVLINMIKSYLGNLSDDNFNQIRDYYKKQNYCTKVKSKRELKEIEKLIDEQTDLSLSLLNAFSKGMIGESQFKLQNEVIEKKLKALLNEKENIIYESKIVGLKQTTEKDIICAIEKLISLDTSQWTNEMMKKIINKIDIDISNEEVEIQYLFQVPKSHK